METKKEIESQFVFILDKPINLKFYQTDSYAEIQTVIQLSESFPIMNFNRHHQQTLPLNLQLSLKYLQVRVRK